MAVTVLLLLQPLRSNIRKEPSEMWQKQWDLSVDTINRLSGSIWEFTDEWFEGKRIAEQGLNPG